MPLYDYQCKDCDAVFEVRATIKEREAGLALECPKCGSRDARQRLTFASLLRTGAVTAGPSCGPSARPECCG